MSKIISFFTRNAIEILAIFAFAWFVFYFAESNFQNYPKSFDSLPKAEVVMAGQTFDTRVVSNENDRSHGLSNVKLLENNQAMLFVFENPGVYGFWMKDMLISIDIIWINEKNEIVHIEKNVSPDTYPSVFFPQRKAKFVLETKNNVTVDLGVEVGSKVLIKTENLTE